MTSATDAQPTPPAAASAAPASLPATPREFERWLRQHGFSRALAKRITSRGFASTDPAAEQAETEQAELLAALDALRRAIGGPDQGGT